MVEPGDTLWRIATCRETSVEALAAANRLRDPQRLDPGTLLRVPSRDRCASETLATRREGAAQRAAPAADEDARQREAARERARGAIAEARARYDEADFAASITASRDAQLALDSVPRDPDSDAVRARSHLLAAMSQVGLEQRERALEELRQAFALDPTLEIPPEDASPRILDLVVEVRSSDAAATRAP
jgi:LysM repeat protein